MGNRFVHGDVRERLYRSSLSRPRNLRQTATTESPTDGEIRTITGAHTEASLEKIIKAM